MAFHVGQKVVCVDAKCWHPKGSWFLNLLGEWTVSTGEMGGLRKGAAYTIARIERGGGLFLAEIQRAGPGRDFGFDPSRFRPVVEHKTDTGFAILEEIRRAVSRELVTREPAGQSKAYP